MKGNEECCGTCRWHRKDIEGDWVCMNDESDYFTDWTEYDYHCEEWESRSTE